LGHTYTPVTKSDNTYTTITTPSKTYSDITKSDNSFNPVTTPSKTYSGLTKSDNEFTVVSDVTPDGDSEWKFTWNYINPDWDTWLELLGKSHWADWYFGTKWTDDYVSLTTPSKTYTSITKSDNTFSPVTTPSKIHTSVTKSDNSYSEITTPSATYQGVTS